MFFHPQQLVCYRSSIMKKAWNISTQKLIMNPASLEEGLAGKQEVPCVTPANPSNTSKSLSRGLKLILALNLLVCIACTHYTITQAYLVKSEEDKLTNILGELKSEISNVIEEIDNIIDAKPATTEDTLKTSALERRPEEESSGDRENDPNDNHDLPVQKITITDNKFVNEPDLLMIEKQNTAVTTGIDDESTTSDVDSTTSTPDASDLSEEQSSVSHVPMSIPPTMHETDTSQQMMETYDRRMEEDNMEHYGLFWLMLQNAASDIPSLSNSSSDEQTGDSDASFMGWGIESLEDEGQNATALDQSVDAYDKNENAEEQSTVDNVNNEEENASEDTNEQEQTTTAESNKSISDEDVLFDEWLANSESSSIPDPALMALLLRSYHSDFEPFLLASEVGVSDYSNLPFADEWEYPSDYMFREEWKRSADNPPPSETTTEEKNLPKGVVVVPLHKEKVYRRPVLRQ